MILSSSSWLRPRATWLTKRSSVASSGWPIAAHSRRNTVSWLAAITTQLPSAVRIDVRRRDALQPGARRAADHAADVVVGDGGFLDGQTGFGQRGVDDLAFAGDGAPVQRGQCALRGEHPGQAVTQRQRQPRRRAAGEAVHVPQSAGGLGHRGVAGLVGLGAGLPVAGDPDQDDAPIAFAQNVIAEVPLLQRARAGSSRR